MREHFRIFARRTAEWMGTSWAFFVALAVVILWAVTGPFFHYSDTWQLVINTSTTVVTFLMVFVIQSTQNRDAMAIHLKIDELLRAITEARTNMVDLEELSDDELCRLKAEFQSMSTRSPGPPQMVHAPVEGGNSNQAQ
ncbi:MAG TPA: low affinity iron permease family protein [Pirellulales bacterium]|nr:low affinity iron permease family protein [Pirellulales bacterium]